LYCLFVFIRACSSHRVLHSFPTRRSSDLPDRVRVNVRAERSSCCFEPPPRPRAGGVGTHGSPGRAPRDPASAHPVGRRGGVGYGGGRGTRRVRGGAYVRRGGGRSLGGSPAW